MLAEVRHHAQSWCAMCKVYKTQTMCKTCDVEVCRSGAFARGKDLGPRTCWEDHIKHGLPTGHGKSFLNTWSKDFEDFVFQGRMPKGTKRRRSGGQAKSIGVV